MRKLDLVFLAAILFTAAALRLWAPWDDVLGSGRVNFLESDSWYHVRLVENQVRNFPHRVTVDPYASPNGQYVAVAPLLDTLVSTAVVLTQGTSASTRYIERVAALTPAVIGVLAVAAVWALGTLAFDRRAGLIGALLAAVLPGHFLDRTLVGFVDHHALEVLLSFAALAALVWTARVPDPRPPISDPRSLIPAGAAGIFLGLYLLAWSSGAYFVAILSGWVLLAPFIGASREAAVAAARSAAMAGATALLVVLAFQDPELFRYNTQVASLAGLVAVSGLVRALAGRTRALLGVLAATAVVAAGLAYVVTPELLRQVSTDLARFHPDPTRMAVLEARPLFLYTGNWEWTQPWTFFRGGFYVGLVAVVSLAASLWTSRRLDHLLIVIFTLVNYVATVGQNRFGYYLVPASALVAGWLCVRLLDWGGVPHAGNPQPQVERWFPAQREVAIMLVAGVAIAPNLLPAALTTTRAGGMPGYWAAAMDWLRTSTPEPFDTPGYYYARYANANAAASYTVMNWWDQGYWLVQAAHRVPVSNPTQSGAPTAAAFLTSTDEVAAIEILKAERARYVMVDWEMPFRDAGNGALAGRFQNLADWARIPTERFYSLCYTRERETDPWSPSWIYTEAYYQTLVYRLMVLGGLPAAPASNTWVMRKQQRLDTSGREFCEVSEAQSYATADEAKRVAATRGPAFVAVGLTPWQPAFPVAGISGLRVVQEFREPQLKPNETPMVRIFELTKSPD